MKTLGLCQPKDRSKVIAPCPVIPDEFGSDSSADQEEEKGEDLDLTTEESVKRSYSSDSKESSIDFSLDGGLTIHFKSGNGLCNGFINTHQSTRDMILPASKLQSTEIIKPTVTLPPLTLNVSNSIVDRSNESKLMSVNLSTPKSLSPRYNKVTKRPSLECLVARLHNRVEETKSNTVHERNDASFDSTASSKNPINQQKCENDSIRKTKLGLNSPNEEKETLSSSNLVVNRPSDPDIENDEKIHLKDSDDSGMHFNKSNNAALAFKCNSAGDRPESSFNNIETCSNFAQESLFTGDIKCRDCVNSSCFKLYLNNKCSQTEIKPDNISDPVLAQLSNSTCRPFVPAFSPLEVGVSFQSPNSNTFNFEDCTLNNQRNLKLVSELNLNQNCPELSVEKPKLIENLHNEDSKNGQHCCNKNTEVTLIKNIDNSRNIENIDSNTSSYDVNKIKYQSVVGLSTNLDNGIRKLDIKETRSEESGEILEKSLANTHIKCIGSCDESFEHKREEDDDDDDDDEIALAFGSSEELAEHSRENLAKEPCEKLAEVSIEKAEGFCKKLAGDSCEDLCEKSAEGSCEKLADNFCEKLSNSNSTTPMFSDTPSDTSQSEMMVRISDAVAALLENTSKGKHPEYTNETYKSANKGDASTKLFSNSNSPIGTPRNDINFSSAFKILDLLQESSEKTSEVLATYSESKEENSFMQKGNITETKGCDDFSPCSKLLLPLPLEEKFSNNSLNCFSSVEKDSQHLTDQELVDKEVKRNSEEEVSEKVMVEHCCSKLNSEDCVPKIYSIDTNENLDCETVNPPENIFTSAKFVDELINSENKDQNINLTKAKLCSEATLINNIKINEDILDANNSIKPTAIMDLTEPVHFSRTEEKESNRFSLEPRKEAESSLNSEKNLETVPLRNADMNSPEISEPKCSASKINDVDITSSHCIKNNFCNDFIDKNFTDHDCETEVKSKPLFRSTNFEIFNEKYVNLVLNRECSYYCSQLMMQHLNFTFTEKKTQNIPPDRREEDSLNCSESNLGASSNVDKTEDMSGVTERTNEECLSDRLHDNEEKQSEAKLDIPHVETCAKYSLSIEDVNAQDPSSLESLRINFDTSLPQTEKDASKNLFCNKNFKKGSTVKEKNIEEVIVNDILEEVVTRENESRKQPITFSVGKPYNKCMEDGDDDKLEQSLLGTQSGDTFQNELVVETSKFEKYSFIDFLKKDKVHVTGECILCKSSFYEDLSLHASQVHTCVSYIPAYQTDAFFHHMRERMGSVTHHSYSDASYGNRFYICKCCGSFFKSMDSVRIHLNIHTQIYMVQSSSQTCMCNKVCFSYPQHKWRTLLFKSKFMCSLCHYLFACENGLVSHLKVVHFFTKSCQRCGTEVDFESEGSILEHNSHHSNEKIQDLIFSFEESLEQDRDQTHFSWNALDNHLNYLDGKVFRLDALKNLGDSSSDRSCLTLPMKVDPLYATTPESMCISPAPEMMKYLKSKLDSKLTGNEVDEYASKGLDMPVQILLRKKISSIRRRRLKNSSKRNKMSLPLYLELQNGLLKKRKCIALSYQDDTVHSTRCRYARKAKSKTQKKNLPPKEKEPKNTEENLLRPSRTRSGMLSKEISEKYEEEKDGSSFPKVSTNEVTGEWVNYHTYICCACGAVFLDLAEIMDHKWESHPGVWCAHTMIQGQEKVPKMFYEQYLPARSISFNLDNSSDESKVFKQKTSTKESFTCSQCQMKFGNREIFHFHVIDCGGLSQIVISKKKNKKGLRFRRRKGQGIPSRRYANNSLAPTPQKNSSERGSGMSTPSKENVHQGITINSSNVVKRLELAVDSIENSKLKSKLEAILSRQKKRRSLSVSPSEKRNLRMKLRKKLQQKRTMRVTRHSESNKDSKEGKAAKRKDRLGSGKVSKDTELQMTTKIVAKNKKRALSDSEKNTVLKRGKNVIKKNIKNLIEKIKDEEMDAKRELTSKKETSITNNQRKFKKLVPLSNKKDKKCAAYKQGSQSTKSILYDQDLNSSGGKDNLDKLKRVLESKRTPKIIGKIRGDSLKKKNGSKLKGTTKRPACVAHSEIGIMEDPTPVKVKQEVPKSVSPVPFDSSGGKDESDSASEPEVIRNFRRKRLIGRTGLRTRKTLATRYSLRPSVNVTKGDAASDDDDDDEDVIIKPRNNAGRRYNIGDDDDTTEETKTTVLPSSCEEDSSLKMPTNVSKQKATCPSRRGSQESVSVEEIPKTENLPKGEFENLPKGEFEKAQKPNRRKSFPSFKSPNSKMNRFYYLAQKNFARLKWSCQNTDSESSGFEGFSPSPKRRKNFSPNPIHNLSSFKLKDKNMNCKTKMIEASPTPVPEPSLCSLEKNYVNDEATPKRAGKRKYSRKSSKTRKRKITPEIVISDSESDVPPDEQKGKEESSVSEKGETKNQSGNLVSDKKSDSKETKSVKDSISSLNTPDNAKGKRKKEETGNVRKKRSKTAVTDQSAKNKSVPNVDSVKVQSFSELDSVDVSTVVKNKLKPKRKYTFKKKLLNDSVNDTSSLKPKNKKILKEVKVLSYRSLNTKDSSPSAQDKPEDEKKFTNSEEELSQQKLRETKKKRPYKKRIRSKLDENSPTVVKTEKYKKMKAPSELSKSSELKDDSVGFLCIDCGLSFDSALSREDHRQDCRNIAFEMSLMAEDHLYECPHCQLTFALKGTQRKHIVSCRMSRSRKHANRRKRRTTSSSSLQSSSVDETKNPVHSISPEPLAFSPAAAARMVPAEEEPEKTLKGAEPEMEVIGSRLESHCQERAGVKEICALLTEFQLCTNDLRCLLTSSSTLQDSITVIHFKAGHAFSPPSVSQNSNYQTLQGLLKRPACQGLSAVFDDTLKSLLKKDNAEDTSVKELNCPNSSAVTIDIARPELLKALSNVEELLKEAADLDSFLKKQQMLLAMKQTFQAGTGS